MVVPRDRPLADDRGCAQGSPDSTPLR